MHRQSTAPEQLWRNRVVYERIEIERVDDFQNGIGK